MSKETGDQNLTITVGYIITEDKYGLKQVIYFYSPTFFSNFFSAFFVFGPKNGQRLLKCPTLT